MPYYLTENWYPTNQYPQLYPNTQEYIQTSDLVINTPSGLIYGFTLFKEADYPPLSIQYRKQNVYYSFPVQFDPLEGYVPEIFNLRAYHWPLMESNVEAIRVTFGGNTRIYSAIVHTPISTTNSQLIHLRGDSISIEEYQGLDSFQNLLNITDGNEDSYATITFASGIQQPYVTLRFDFSSNLLPYRGFFMVTPYVRFHIPSPPSGALVTSWMRWGSSNVNPYKNKTFSGTGRSMNILPSNSLYGNLVTTNSARNTWHIPTNGTFSSLPNIVRLSPVIFNQSASVFSSSPFIYAPFISAGLTYSKIASIYPDDAYNDHIMTIATTNKFALTPIWVVGNANNPRHTLWVHFRFSVNAPSSAWELRIYDAGFLVAPTIDSRWLSSYNGTNGFLALPYNPYIMSVTRDNNDSTETEDISANEIIFSTFPFGINPQEHSIQLRARSTSGSPSNVLITKYGVFNLPGHEYYSTNTETIQVPTNLTTVNISFPTGVITYPYITVKPV